MSTWALQAIGASHVLYLLIAGSVMWLWLRWIGASTSLMDAAFCALPALLGVLLALTSTADKEQYLVRLMAAGIFAPILLLFWATGVEGPAMPRAPWLYGAGAAAAHIAIFLGALTFAYVQVTRVPPEAGVAPITAETLGARLLSLNEIGGPFEVTNPSPNEFLVNFLYKSQERSYRILLNLNPVTSQIRVRERFAGRITNPASENERSMRAVGDSYVDASRPEASQVFSKSAMATFIKAARLRDTPLNMSRGKVEVSRTLIPTLDETGVITLICAVSIRSGWDWRPAFFGTE
jgi:hypothetical protein